MATQTVEFHAPSGQTITAKLFTMGSDTEVASASATERTNDKGTYRVAYTDAPAATYRITALVGSVAVAKGFVTLAAATADYYPHSFKSVTDTLTTLTTTAATAASPVLQATTIATLASQTSFTLDAGSADDDAYNDCLIVFVDSATSTQRAVGCITDYTGASKTVRLLAGPAFTIAAGDTVYVMSSLETVRVVVDANLTSSAGTVCHIAAWLEWRGQRVAISGATASIAFRRIDQDINLFAVTEADLLGSSAIYENAFRLTKSTPGFTDDRMYDVIASITHNGRTFTGTQLVPCLGGA